MDTPLVDTNVTGTQIATWLSDHYHQTVHLESCEAKKIAAGQGFTASIIRVFLKYTNENDQNSLPNSVIIKTPSIAAIQDLVKKLDESADIQQTIDFLTAGHTMECEAYRILGRDPPIPLPRIYAAEHCRDGKMGAIVMEDLCDKASIIGDPLSTLTLDQLYAAIDAMVDWHTWCLTTDTDWKPHFEAIDSDNRKRAYQDWIQMMFNCYERTKNKYPNKFDNLDLSSLAKKIFDMEQLQDITNEQCRVIPEVIVHGDFYANNLMYETSKDEFGHMKIGSKLLAIIDWPMSHRGCGMEDLARLMCFSVDTATRRERTVDIIRYYYEKLLQKVGREKVDGSYEQVLETYYFHFMMSGLFFVMMLDWLQNLWVVTSDEQEREKKQKLALENCVSVYEEISPFLEKLKEN